MIDEKIERERFEKWFLSQNPQPLYKYPWDFENIARTLTSGKSAIAIVRQVGSKGQGLNLNSENKFSVWLEVIVNKIPMPLSEKF